MSETTKYPLDEQLVITSDELQRLMDKLSSMGFDLFGPTVQDSAVVYDRISKLADLPAGWSDRQEAGSYRLVKSKRPALFDHVVGPHNWKRILYPAVANVWSAHLNGRAFRPESVDSDPGKPALFGVRSCDLHAIAIHDKILTRGEYQDPRYRRLKESRFIVAVNCTRPGGTCFCASMDTGPAVTSGYDLALTELFKGKEHIFLVQVGSVSGHEVIAELDARAAGEEELAAAEKAMQKAASSMGRALVVDGLEEGLCKQIDDPHWETIAERCLTCGSCTMVCPTCFCVNIQDSTDLSGARAERSRLWDSCFTLEFSYIHGGSIRATEQSRYRQWMMHKLAYWQGQFGSSGCVGCGRCITWCPVGIDITQEAGRFLSMSEAKKKTLST